jgi:hypothetical protein
MFKSTISILFLAGLAGAASNALAGPSDDADARLRAIASGDVQAVMAAYGDNARLEWIGGPLDGAYTTADAIRGVWTRFTGAQGALKLSVDKLEESANPKGATISANALFEGKAAIKVRYILTLRNGKVVAETWQIDPDLAVSAAR